MATCLGVAMMKPCTQCTAVPFTYLSPEAGVPGSPDGCENDAMVISNAEYMSLQTVPFNPLLLTQADGALIGSAIVGVWALAWVSKALILALKSDGEALD